MKVKVVNNRYIEYEIEVEANDTVEVLKDKIFEVEGTPASQQHLFARSATLEDGKLLIEYGIIEGTLITMRQESISQMKKVASASPAAKPLTSFFGVTPSPNSASEKKTAPVRKMKTPKSPKRQTSVPAPFGSGISSSSHVESILVASENHLSEVQEPPRITKATKPKTKSTSKKSKNGRPPKGGKKERMLMRVFSSYIYKILKQVHPDLGISNRAMAIMNGVVNDIFDRIVAEVKILNRPANLSSATARQIMYAARLVFPGELAKHAVQEGTKAVTRYQEIVAPKPASTAGSAPAISKTGRAGLLFPVGRLHRLLSMKLKMRTGVTTAVMTAAVLEYICAEVRRNYNQKKKSTKPRRCPYPYSMRLL
eukprot:TRINITY_DN2122_c0_g1_i1.p1 TRINITY_DN2122_c0_g1~~TRINITY_DN2122_c0_g1_i1.p1  ORF type:complete len:368 (-),score=67.24 TRINITY_DN2122_c0_g1_i1:314-1417(-)